MPHLRPGAWLTLVGLLSACAGEPPAPVPPPATSALLPRLVPVAFTPAEDAPPFTTADRFALGPKGDVALPMAQGSERMLGIFDSTGAMRTTAGVSGEGPGELRIPTPAVFEEDGLIISDMGLPRVVTFDPQNGKVIATTPISQPIPILGAFGARLLMAVPTATGLMLPGWHMPGDADFTPLVSPSDSFVVTRFAPAADTRLSPLATLGAWRGGVLVADGRGYAIGVYDGTGRFLRALTREVAPRFATPTMITAFQRRAEAYHGPDGKAHSPARITADVDKFRAAQQPHFVHSSPLREDRLGRIWIVGMEGDSAFADLFTPTGQIGHLGIACPAFTGRWSLNGEWLALLCDAPAASDRGAVLQLYRIVESGA